MSYPAPPVYGQRTSYHEPLQPQYSQSTPQYKPPAATHHYSSSNSHISSPYNSGPPMQYQQPSPLPSQSQQGQYFPPPPSPYTPQSPPLYQTPSFTQPPPSLPPRKSNGLIPHQTELQPPRVSPAPSSIAPDPNDLRQRLQNAGVSEQQITQILNASSIPNAPPVQATHPQQQAPGNLPALAVTQHGIEAPDAMLSKLSLHTPPATSKPQQADFQNKDYPFNLAKNIPWIFEQYDIDDDISYIIPPGCDQSTRLYTLEYTSPTQRVRRDLVMKRHNKRDLKQPRWVGECAYYPKTLWPKFTWESWGEWPASGEQSEVYTWLSDVGTLDNKRGMYWHKSHEKSRTGALFACYCRLLPEDTNPEGEVKVNWADPLICKVEQPNSTDSVITISPGYVHNQDQLDEMISLAMMLRFKYTFDISCWLVSEKKWTDKDLDNVTDISFVPHNVNGWHNVTFTNEVQSSSDKWKNRGKLMASVASLGKNVATLGYQIGVATGSVPPQ